MKKSNTRKWHLFFALVAVAIFYFILIVYATAAHLPTLSNPFILYSNHNQDDLKTIFCSAIKQAKKEIFIEMYSLTDKEILHLLAEKAKENVRVKILYDKTASPLIEKHFPFSVEVTPYQSKGLMHRKILIIDEEMVYIGSANMTTQSLKMHDNLVVGLYDRGLAQFLKNSAEASPFDLQALKATFWRLPNPDGLAALIEQIHTAKKTVYVALFTLTHPILIDALIEAKKRDVEVHCAIDHYTAKGASKKQIERLLEAGIPVYASQGLQLFHHKWALIDDSTLILGSANWTKAAFTINYDCFIIFRLLNEDQKKFMQRMWKKIRCESISTTLEGAAA